MYGQSSYTYPQMRARVRRLASALAARGVEPGDRVAILCPNIPPMLEAHYGVPLAGAVLVPINTRLSSDEVGYILNHSGGQCLLWTPSLPQSWNGCKSQIESVTLFVSIVDGELGADAAPQTLDGPEYEAFLATGSEAPIAIPVAGRVRDDLDQLHVRHHRPAEGRDGPPSRGVPERHRRVHDQRHRQRQPLPLDPPDVPLQRLVLHLGRHAVGGTHVCLRRVEPGESGG